MFLNFLGIMIQENVLKSVHTYPLPIKQSIYVSVTVLQAILLMNQLLNAFRSALKVNSATISPIIVLAHVHPTQNILEIPLQENVFFTVLMSYSQMLTIIDNVRSTVWELDPNILKILQENV